MTPSCSPSGNGPTTICRGAFTPTGWKNTVTANKPNSSASSWSCTPYGLSLQWLCDPLMENLVRNPIRSNTERRIHSSGELWSWIHFEKKYVINWFNNPYVSRETGEITDT
jgi:hypothetical protein